MEESDIKDLAVSLVFEKYQPANEETVTGHMTADDFLQIINSSVSLTKEELSNELHANGYVMSLYEGQLGFWVKEVRI